MHLLKVHFANTTREKMYESDFGTKDDLLSALWNCFKSCWALKRGGGGLITRATCPRAASMPCCFFFCFFFSPHLFFSSLPLRQIVTPSASWSYFNCTSPDSLRREHACLCHGWVLKIPTLGMTFMIFEFELCDSVPCSTVKACWVWLRTSVCAGERPLIPAIHWKPAELRTELINWHAA